MESIWQFYVSHPEAGVVTFWLFSAFLSTMPPINDNAPYLVRWMHDFSQLIAANMNRKSISSTTAQTQQGSFEKTVTEGPASAVPSIPKT